MRPTTDFVGHLDISPALNAAEISYVTAFGAPRRVGPDSAASGSPARTDAA